MSSKFRIWLAILGDELIDRFLYGITIN